MPFGIISRTGPGMRQVVGFGDWSTGRDTFGGEFGARYCNQWGLYGVRVRQRRDAALFPNYLGKFVTVVLLPDTNVIILKNMQYFMQQVINLSLPAAKTRIVSVATLSF